MKPKKLGNGKITALYERLSRDDDLTGDSNSIIELILVLAYFDTKRDTSGYDSTVYPPLETVPRRFAISHRNRWMVETSDVVVAYVLHDWGGAAATLRCARKKKKQIISYFDEVDS